MWYQWKWLSCIMKCVLGLVGKGEGEMREEVRYNHSSWAAEEVATALLGCLVVSDRNQILG